MLFLISQHDRPKEGGKQIHFQLKAIPRVKKSNLKWKCEKEIVQKGNLEMYKNQLTSLVSDLPVFFHRSFPFPCYFFTSGLTFSINVKNGVLTFRTEPEKRKTEAVVRRCSSK